MRFAESVRAREFLLILVFGLAGTGCGGGSSSKGNVLRPGDGPPPRLTLVSAEHVDVDRSGSSSQGDQILLTFSGEVKLGTGADAPDVARDLALPVDGDSLGAGAAIAAVPGEKRKLAVVLGSSPSLTTAGTFLPAVTVAGSPSGIGIAAAIHAGAIVGSRGQTASPGAGVDITAGSSTQPPPSGTGTAPEVYWAEFDDTDNDGAVSQGDVLIVGFSMDVTLGTGALAPLPSDFHLPVSGDSFGVGASVRAGLYPDEVEIVLGAGAVISVNGTFDDAVLAAGSPSGIDVAGSIRHGAITNGTGVDADATGAVDIDGQLSGPPGNAHVVSADFVDVNGDGRFDSGDTLTIVFSEPILVMGGTLDPATDFELPVAGDTLGSADVQVGLSGYDLVITLASDTVLEVNGTFAAGAITPGSPSGIDIAAGLPANVISDQQGRRVNPAGPVDVGGTLVPPPPVTIAAATFIDRDWNGVPGLGDDIVLRFSEAIAVGSGASAPQAAHFALPVLGDSLGTDPQFVQTAPDRLAIRLGAGASLTVAGTFAVGATAAGSPSAIDFAPNLAVTPISSVRGAKCAPAALPIDIAPPRGTVAEGFGDQAHLDAAGATAEWGVGGSGVAAGSLVAVDTRAGTEDLVIATSGTLDTDAGTLGGQPLPGFRGAGVFEVKRFEVAQGASIIVTGKSPLQVYASADALVAGVLRLDGAAGADQAGWNTNTPGRGGEPGPGGFAGGAGGRGALAHGEPGRGPAGGRGGTSENTPGGGGGGGFGADGAAGETEPNPFDAPAGAGGAGGARLAALDLVPLEGGSGGGGGGADDDLPLALIDAGDDAGPGGGGGGGALRIAAAQDLVVRGTISANGGDGGDGDSIGSAGGGGGAGGAILLQSAQKVRLASSATVTARGGAGGSGVVSGGAGGQGVVLCEDADGVIELPLVSGTVYPAPVGAVAPAVTAPQPLSDLRILVDSTIDTDTGAVSNNLSLGLVNGAFEVGTFEVAAGVTLRVRGSKPLVIRASDAVLIDGTIDVAGEAGEGARGGLGGRGGRGVAGGADGGNGGTVTTSGTPVVLVSEVQAKAGGGPGAGTSTVNVRDGAGGGGGSFGTEGRPAPAGGSAGPRYGNDLLDPLLGGSGGGGGAASNDGTFAGGGGGGAGGGAVRIECPNDIVVNGTIDANGGNGGPSTDAGPGGGGSGGAIHLVAGGRIRVTGRLQAAGGYAPHGAGAGGDGWIRLEDSAGDFGSGMIEPAAVAATFATSVATSTWYPVLDAQGTAVADARFLAILARTTVPPGTSAVVEAEGARADPQNPAQPDLATRTGFTRDPERLASMQFVRLRLTFRSDRTQNAAPAIDEVALPFE